MYPFFFPFVDDVVAVAEYDWPDSFPLESMAATVYVYVLPARTFLSVYDAVVL